VSDSALLSCVSLHRFSIYGKTGSETFFCQENLLDLLAETLKG